MKKCVTSVSCALALMLVACQHDVVDSPGEPAVDNAEPVSTVEHGVEPDAAKTHPTRAKPPVTADFGRQRDADAVGDAVINESNRLKLALSDEQSAKVTAHSSKHFKQSAKSLGPPLERSNTQDAKQIPSRGADKLLLPAAPDFETIKAQLAADPVVTVPGNPGDLRVWVGDQNAKADFPADMAQASANIITSMRPSTVKITPNAPAFNTTPESVCSKFDPTGTTVHFELLPRLERAGKFRVGAGVWLYESADCSGIPNPKEAPDLEVEVVVKVVPDDMLKTVREGISKFWAGLVGLIVALLLFFARNLLKRWFGFDGK